MGAIDTANAMLDKALCGFYAAQSPSAVTIELPLPGDKWEAFPLSEGAPVWWKREPFEGGQAVRFMSSGAAKMGAHFHDFAEEITQVSGTLIMDCNRRIVRLGPGDKHVSKPHEYHAATYGPSGGETVCQWPGMICEKIPCKVIS
jgi:hypothetical protein